ncbi:MAG: molybdenum cofactor guanylyltransferase [Candidatus Thorarchaeota archaeon]
MDKSRFTVAVIAGGDSRRYKSEKALAKFRNRTLLEHMVEIGRTMTDNVLVIVSDDEQKERFGAYIDSDRIKTDPEDSVKCALTGALTAFEFTETQHVLLLPVDSPLANVRLLRSLVGLADSHGAVVPSWPNGYIEPLHSVYLAEHAYKKGLEVVENGKTKMRDFLEALSNVLYISTEVLKVHDPELKTFSNINTERDLRELQKQTNQRN